MRGRMKIPLGLGDGAEWKCLSLLLSFQLFSLRFVYRPARVEVPGKPGNGGKRQI